MTQQTTNYQLKKYDATDKPDLTDQYNKSMDVIDAKLKEANDRSNDASQKAVQNTAKLNSLGVISVSTATQNKAKWDKAASDATTALQKVQSLPTLETMPAGLKEFCTALGLTTSNANSLGTALNHFLNRTPATRDGGYTAKNLADTKLTNEGLPFVPASTGQTAEREGR